MRRLQTQTVEAAGRTYAYIERGPRDGPPVFLLHGFPDDARTWDAVAPVLASQGYRTIAPFTRGFGATRLAAGEPRGGEVAALARDVTTLADALGVERFHVAGHDWGARAGYALAVLDPARVLSLTAMAVAYGTNVAGQRLDVEQARAYWYQWYFATERGAAALRDERVAFCRDLWRTWSPGWRFDDDAYLATAASFDNPDFTDVVLHAYRQRWGFVPGDERYAADRARLEALPAIDVPTTVIMGRDDACTLVACVEGTQRWFRAAYRVVRLDGAGHFVTRERPDDVGRCLLERLQSDVGAARQEGSS